MVNGVISLIIVLMFAFFLHAKLKIKSGISPIISLTSIISVVIVFSLFGFLFVGVLAVYAIVTVLFVYTIIQKKAILKKLAYSYFDVGVVLFIISSILMLIFLSIKQPLYSEWDEFSFWGTSQKLLSINDQIYTFYDSSLIGKTTPPALAVLSYFFGAFNVQFYEWVSFYAYDVMFFAVCASFTSVFKKDKYFCGISIFLLGFLLPYFFTVYSKAMYLIPTYIYAYADIPLGMIFAACIGMYFVGSTEVNVEHLISESSNEVKSDVAAQNKSRTGGDIVVNNVDANSKIYFSSNTKNIIALVPLIFFLTLVKDMGFALSCLIAFFVFFDLMFFKKQYSFLFLKNVVAKIIATGTIILTAVVAFIAWAYHMSLVLSVNRFNLGGEENIGMAEMLIRGVTELFSAEKSEKFTTISNSMLQAFFHNEVAMIGSCFVVICFITLLFIAAFIMSNKAEKIRTVVLYITAMFGFVCYYIFNTFLYVYIFKDNGYSLPSFGRYIYPYFFGWLMMAVFLILLSTNKNKVFGLLKLGALNMLVLGIFMLFTFLVSTDNMFLGVDKNNYSLRYTIKEKIDFLGDVVEDDDVVYLYSGMGDYGYRWFIYALEYAQNIFVLEVTELYTFDEGVYDGTPQEGIEAARQHIIADFKQKGVTNLMIDYSDYVTEVLLAEDFESPTVQYGLTGIAYYEVEYIGEDDIEFHLIKGGHITND